MSTFSNSIVSPAPRCTWNMQILYFFLAKIRDRKSCPSAKTRLLHGCQFSTPLLYVPWVEKGVRNGRKKAPKWAHDDYENGSHEMMATHLVNINEKLRQSYSTKNDAKANFSLVLLPSSQRLIRRERMQIMEILFLRVPTVTNYWLRTLFAQSETWKK